MRGEIEFIILAVIAVGIIWIYESCPRVNKGEEIMSVLVVCALVHFWISRMPDENKNNGKK